jgi:transmembrane sensor
MSRDRWAEALTWYVVSRQADSRDFTEAQGREWRDWYADSTNRRVFDSVSRLLADRGRYRERDRLGKRELEEDQYDLSVPIAQWRRPQAQRQARRQRARPGGGWRWRLSAGLGAAAIAVILMLQVVWLEPGDGPGAQIYRTDVGGIKDVHLRDGSSIILGGQTQLSVRFSARTRSVRLIEGEAWFKVAHDPNWPFVVAAGDGTVTAVGTAFLVTRESDRVVVTVTEGTVEVSARRPGWPPLRLVQRFSMGSILPQVPVSRGEELTFNDSGALRPVTPANTRAATAWTHGRLTFDDQPLRYVVETINRYSLRRIVVGPAAGALQFSGIVFDNDIEDWLKSLEIIFPVTVREQGATVYIRMRSSTAAS